MIELVGAITYGLALHERAKTGPDDTALVWIPTSGEPGYFAWRALDEGANRVARALHAIGIGPGSNVVCGIANDPACLLTAFAVWRLGATVVVCRPNSSDAAMHAVAHASSAKLCIGRWVDRPADTAIMGYPELMEASACYSRDRLDHDPVSVPGLVLASSGSTGQPKLLASESPHYFFPWETAGRRADGRRDRMVQGIFGPMYHAMVAPTAFDGLLRARRTVLLEDFSSELAINTVKTHGVQLLTLSPPMMYSIMRTPGVQKEDLSSIQSLRHAGSPCAAHVKRWWIDALGPSRVFEFYGTTEEIGNTLITGDEWLERPGSVGRPLTCEIRIADDIGRQMQHGQIGEVYMRRPLDLAVPRALSDSAMSSTPDGFLSVGDLGSLDEDGYLYLRGRKTDILDVDGRQVLPAEIESVLLDHPGVDDAAVFVDTSSSQARLHAMLVLRPDVRQKPSHGELESYCQDRLETIHIPRLYSFVPRLPRTRVGKLLRHELANHATSERHQQSNGDAPDPSIVLRSTE